MRGYRLLKSCGLNRQERQNVLTQTGNSTQFTMVRRALRAMFSEDSELAYRSQQRKPQRGVWWTGDQDDDWFGEDYGDDHAAWYGNEPNAYWNDSWDGWWQDDMYYGSWDDSWEDHEDEIEPIPADETGGDLQEGQLREAAVLANEANKTLAQAREAVRKVRQARGYYAPESTTGKGMTPNSSPSRSPSSKGSSFAGGKGKQKGKFGPCFICNRPGHSYLHCPDRFAKGKFGHMKGKGKGKFKGKSKMSNYAELYTLSVLWNAESKKDKCHTRVVLDTGAAENAIGAASLDKLLRSGNFTYDVQMHDMPVFRFGNGQRMRACSRVQLYDTSLGSIHFYVLAGGEAEQTPPLLGAQTLRDCKAQIRYGEDCLVFERWDDGFQQAAVASLPVHVLPSGHLTIDLLGQASQWQLSGSLQSQVGTPNDQFLVDATCQSFGASFSESAVCSDEWYIPLYTFSLDGHVNVAHHDSQHSVLDDCNNMNHSLQSLAQRISDLASRVDGNGSSRPERPKDLRVSLLRSTSAQVTSEPIRDMGVLHQMRSAIGLCQQEGSWRTPAHGPGSQHGPGDYGRVPEDSAGRRGDRVNGERSHDGDQGPDVAKGIHQQYEDQYDCGGVPQEVGNCQSQEDSKPQEGAKLPTDTSDRGDQGPDQGCHFEAADGVSQALTCGIQGGGRCNPADGAHDEIQKREARSQSEGHTHGMGGGRSVSSLFGRGGEQGSISAIWNALSSLRQRMNGSSSCLKSEPIQCGDSPSTPIQDGNLAPFQENPKPNKNSTTFTAHDETSDGKLRSCHGHVKSSFEPYVKPPAKPTSRPNHLLPGVAKKIAVNAAVMGAMLLGPCHGLMGQLQDSPDFIEVACSPNSGLCLEMESKGYHIQRINYKEGYDLESKKGTALLKSTLKKQVPRFTWVSLPCTRISPLQNLTPRNDEEWAKFEKRQAHDLQRAYEVADGIMDVMENHDDVDFAWEWPANAKKGWDSKAISMIQRRMRRLGRSLFWCRLDGCAYGLCYNSIPVRKGWWILTSSRRLWLSLQKRCPGHKEHAECRGVIAQASAYYPPAMIRAATKATISSWTDYEESYGINLSLDVERHLLSLQHDDDDEANHDVHMVERLRQEDPQVLALTRNRFPAEPPVGRKLELIRQQMLRVHRASGHSSFQNLQRLLRARKAPDWAIDLAGQLECPACKEAKRIRPSSVASLKELPGLFEVIGMDVFEYEHGNSKFKFLLMRDRASGLVQVEFLQEYGGPEQERNWEPKTSDIVNCVSRWLMVNPTPRWLLTDSATYFTSAAFIDFCGMSGIGLLTTPAESHEMLGSEEACIGVLKETVKRLLKDEPELAIGDAFRLSAHGHNQTCGSSGFSPFQWSRGSSSPHESLPLGADPKKAFAGMLRLREKARVAYEMSNAKQKLSKPNNSINRPSMVYKTGDLVMLWRQRNRPGKVSGQWVGPTRLLLQEGGTTWLATGSTLIRARLNQIRRCTRREELSAALEGASVLSTPTTVESLLRSFTGRNYVDATGDVPSERQRRDDIQGGEVLVDPDDRPRTDAWRLIIEDGKKWLIRTHNAPRLALFTPARTQDSPYTLEELTGKRVTLVRPMLESANEVRIEDDFNTETDPHRHLTERWRGETRFEVKPEETSSSSSKRPLSRPSVTQKKLKSVVEEGPEPIAPEPDAGETLPAVPEISPLTTALRDRGPDQLDGIRVVNVPVEMPQCTVPECILPGGHEGAHQDSQDVKFVFDSQGRYVEVEGPDDPAPIPSDSESSDSSVEMIPDGEAQSQRKRKHESGGAEMSSSKRPDDAAFCLEIPLEMVDLEQLARKPKKASIWLSKKMEAKGKEVEWRKLDMPEKIKFDEAQSKELSNVLVSRALRSLTNSELEGLDRKRIMQMRWVLTYKADSSAKARLVVLGYQAHNLVSVQAAAPTMARLSRNVLLAVCSNLKFRLKSGDVTSAFLQASQSLEDQDLHVWAPAELATLFGAPADDPVMPLKICRAFYGLVQSPRLWYDHVCQTMISQGWRKLSSDGCLFILLDSTGRLKGIAGIHVDDFLIGGDETDSCYQEAERALMEAYRWGKWQTGSFEFAGGNVIQRDDFSIEMSQESYVDKWLDEIILEKDRWLEKKSKLTDKEISALRGLIGTMSWKASQTGPQYSADVGLLLSEVPYATVDTIFRANKLAREIKRDSKQVLRFPSWHVPLNDLTCVTWADASNSNRPDKSSTMGMIAGIAPKSILSGEEVPVALVSWKSSKCPRQCLGSNGAEVQAITEAEDLTFKVRGLLVEIQGIVFDRKNLYDKIRQFSSGAVVMDSRGVFDAATRNVSALHGLRSSRAGYELTLSVNQARSIQTHFRWVNGLSQLADPLTKANSRKVLLHMMSMGQRWRLVHDEKFTAGKKIRKQEMLKRIRDMENQFIQAIDNLARINRWPQYDEDPRSMGDAFSEPDMSHCQVDSSSL